MKSRSLGGALSSRISHHHYQVHSMHVHAPWFSTRQKGRHTKPSTVTMPTKHEPSLDFQRSEYEPSPPCKPSTAGHRHTSFILNYHKVRQVSANSKCQDRHYEQFHGVPKPSFRLTPHGRGPPTPCGFAAHTVGTLPRQHQRHHNP